MLEEEDFTTGLLTVPPLLDDELLLEGVRALDDERLELRPPPPPPLPPFRDLKLSSPSPGEALSF